MKKRAVRDWRREFLLLGSNDSSSETVPVLSAPVINGRDSHPFEAALRSASLDSTMTAMQSPNDDSLLAFAIFSETRIE